MVVSGITTNNNYLTLCIFLPPPPCFGLINKSHYSLFNTYVELKINGFNTPAVKHGGCISEMDKRGNGCVLVYLKNETRSGRLTESEGIENK